MKLTMRQRRAVTQKLAYEYRRAGKKKEILDTLVKVTGYNRCHASWLLRHWGMKYLIQGEADCQGIFKDLWWPGRVVGFSGGSMGRDR